MVIWCRMNRAAACDHANFTTKSSPRAALDIWNTGSSWPTGPGIVTGSPASAGAITRSASTTAAGDGSGSQLIERPDGGEDGIDAATSVSSGGLPAGDQDPPEAPVILD